MSFVPLSRSQLKFIADEFWPGGGENGDGRDLYGVAEHRGALVEETTDADLVAEALHPSDAVYEDRYTEEEFDRELDEMETEADPTISVDGQPLDEFLAYFGDDSYREFDRRPRDEYDDLPDGEDGPDSLELAMAELQAEYRESQRQRWNEDDLVSGGAEFDGLVSSCTSEASRNLARFERDGVRKESLSVERAEEFRYKDYRRREWPNIGPHWMYDPTTGYSGPNPRWNGRQRFDSWKRHRMAQYRLRSAA